MNQEIVHPDLFRPMSASEVSRYIKVSTRRLEEWRRRTNPAWLPWAIVIFVGLILRQILVSTIIGLSVRGA